VLPGLAVIWVIVIVLLLAAVLDRGLLRPLGRVMRQREAAIRSAQELAEESASRARAAAAEFEQRTRTVQTEIYREMEENRRQANERRAALMAQTRHEVDATLADAAARLQAEAAAARDQLEKDAEALGTAVVERVLGRKVS
jgi:F0F1-type ATP synthase membrane subunit b/b'